MRGMTLWGAWLVLACLALAPGILSAQPATGPMYAPADPQIPIPFGSMRPEDGGLYTFGKFAMFRTTNPLKAQTLAIRGFVTSDNTVPRTIGTGVTTGRRVIHRLDQVLAGNFPNFTPDLDIFGNIVIQGPFGANQIQNYIVIGTEPITGPAPVNSVWPAGTFLGSGEKALDVAQLTGESSYMPGFEIGLGWKFRDGSAITLSWMYLSEAQYRAGATLSPTNNINDVDLYNTFLFSPVYNFPPEYAGADFKVGPAVLLSSPVSAQAAFGIWNAASIMTIEFLQRVQQWDITYREPIYDTENYRLNGLIGPRFTWIWERFKWTTTSIGQTSGVGLPAAGIVSVTGPDNVAIYSNVTSNRMYGASVGCEQEWYLGHGFAFHLLTRGTLYLDSVKERAKYETAAKYLGLPENKRAKREFTIVPEAQVGVGIMWYPTEFVQVYFDYELWGMMNTLASRHPVDFDYSQIAPKWAHMNRLFDGFRAGIAFTW